MESIRSMKCQIVYAYRIRRTCFHGVVLIIGCLIVNNPLAVVLISPTHINYRSACSSYNRKVLRTRTCRSIIHLYVINIHSKAAQMFCRRKRSESNISTFTAIRCKRYFVMFPNIGSGSKNRIHGNKVISFQNSYHNTVLVVRIVKLELYA